MADADRDDAQLSNIVMMGMGEPLYNFDNGDGAQDRHGQQGIALSRRRITVDLGDVPMIPRVGENLTSISRCRCAVVTRYAQCR
jgi:23S rRNA (adenine2503-C2)-methyltransferase